MAAGVPAVAADNGGNAEAIEHGVTGYIVRERTPEAFAAPIVELLRNEPLRAAMAAQARARCRERFDLDQAVRRVEEYYAALLSTVPAETETRER